MSAPDDHAKLRGWSAVGHAVALALFVLFTVWNNVAWVEADNAPPSDDDSTHLAAVFTTGRSWTGVRDVADGLLSWQQRYPPFGYTPGLLAVMCGVTSTKRVVESENVFVVVLLVSAFAAGWAAGGAWCGWMCALAVGGSPPMLLYARRYFLDVPEMAMAAAALACFAWSDRFERLGSSIACGLFCGLAMLTKVASLPLLLPLAVVSLRGRALLSVAWIACVCTGTWMVGAHSVDVGRTCLAADELVGFVTATVMVAVGLGLGVRGLGPRWGVASNVLLAFASGYAVSGFWYLNNARGLREAHGVIADTMGRSGVWASFSYMGNMFYMAAPLLAVGIGLALVRRAAPSVVWASLLGVLSMAAWIAMTVPAERYVLPLLPCVAVLATWWIPSLPSRPRFLLCGVLATAFLWQATGGWWDAAPASAWLPRVAPGPRRSPPPLEEILDAIGRDNRETGFVLVGLAGADGSPVQDRTLTLAEVKNPRRLQFVSLDEHGGARAYPGYAGEPHPPCRYVMVVGDVERWTALLAREQRWTLQPLGRSRFEGGPPIAVFRVDGAHGTTTAPPPPRATP